MADEYETTQALLTRRRELEEELAEIKSRLVPSVLGRLSLGAAHIDSLGSPTAERAGGSLLHTAQCVDVAGWRLRDALGAELSNGDLAEPREASAEAKPIPLILYLGREPDLADAQAMAALDLQPVFSRGRWRPCTLYTGEVAPERLVSFVLKYGGDCHVLQRERRRSVTEA